MSCLLLLDSPKREQWPGNMAASGCCYKSPRSQLLATIIWTHIFNIIRSFVL
jgi:hypothetical protein